MILGNGQLAAATRDWFGEVDFCWVCYDTPVDENDQSDVDWVIAQVRPTLDMHTGLVVLSSQLPVGTCGRMEATWPHLQFAVVPENIRVKEGADDYKLASRFVVGTRHAELREFFLVLFDGYRVLFMSPESAEMVKHTLNGYLAMCIAYINEIGDLCNTYGADVNDVTAGLVSDRRVSPDAPLRAVMPYMGGTIGRDVATMRRLAPEAKLIEAIGASNWRRIRRVREQG